MQPMKRASFQCVCILARGVSTVPFPLDTLAWGGQVRRRKRWDTSLHHVTSVLSLAALVAHGPG